MTRIAIISDVHADARALDDALALAARLGCDFVLCAGDVVDLGRAPEETVATLREFGVPCVRGNHDRWLLARPAAERGLSADAVAFVEALPARWSRRIEGVRVAVSHATPRSDVHGIEPSQASGVEVERWLDEAEADVLVVGHTHVPMRLAASRGVIVNPGALLRDPAEPSPAAMLWDPQERRFVPMPPTGGGTLGVLELPSLEFRVYRASDGVEVETVRRTIW